MPDLESTRCNAQMAQLKSLEFGFQFGHQEMGMCKRSSSQSSANQFICHLNVERGGGERKTSSGQCPIKCSNRWTTQRFIPFDLRNSEFNFTATAVKRQIFRAQNKWFLLSPRKICV